MSIYQDHNSTDPSGGDLSILNLTVSDFLRDVCSNGDGASKDIADSFIEMLIQLLFKFAELLPLFKVKINRIIRVLVDYGVQYRSSLYIANRDGRNKTVEMLQTCSNVDRQMLAYSMLYDLDKRSNDIQETKMKIYNELFKKDSTNVNIKVEAIDNSYNVKDSSFQKVESFHPASIKKLAELVRSNTILKTDNVSHSRNVVTESSSNVKSNTILKTDVPHSRNVVTESSSNVKSNTILKTDNFSHSRNIVTESSSNVKSNTILKTDNVSHSRNIVKESPSNVKSKTVLKTDNVSHSRNIETDSSSNGNQVNLKEDNKNPVPGTSSNYTNKYKNRNKSSISMQNISSPILCIKVHEDVCMAGCENGQLQMFCLKSGNMVDSIQAHLLSITSLVLWNNILVTGSLDRSLKSFNLKRKSTRRITIEHAIETTTGDSDGVLYAGTSTGKIFRFNILSLTQIGSFFHVSSTKILSMKVFYEVTKVLLAVLVENKPIAIRSAETGTLLKTIQVNNIISFDICDHGNSWFGISEDFIYAMSLDKYAKMKTISSKNLSRVCSYGNSIVACSSDGRIAVYDKKLILKRNLSVELRDDVTAVAIWKNFAVISYKNIRELKLLDLHQN